MVPVRVQDLRQRPLQSGGGRGRGLGREKEREHTDFPLLGLPSALARAICFTRSVHSNVRLFQGHGLYIFVSLRILVLKPKAECGGVRRPGLRMVTMS